MLRVDALSFSYPGKEIFRDLTLDFSGGELVGLIGENGSGKSTFFHLLAGELKPSSGSIEIGGKFLGVAFQDEAYPVNVKVGEVLDFVRAHHIKPYSKEELAENFVLAGYLNQSCEALSGGQRQRLSLALAFAGRPDIILLDEPASGLDRESREHLMDVVEAYLREKKALILMISHHPDEIAENVSRFLTFCPGKNSVFVDPERYRLCRSLKEVSFVDGEGNRCMQVVEDSDAELRRIVREDVPFSDLKVKALSLEEVIERCIAL